MRMRRRGARLQQAREAALAAVRVVHAERTSARMLRSHVTEKQT